MILYIKGGGCVKLLGLRVNFKTYENSRLRSSFFYKRETGHKMDDAEQPASI